MAFNHRDKLRDAVYGAAVGDALGVPYEFMGRDSFECDAEMRGGGAHGQPAGTFSDDTSMILATCDSIRAKRGRVDCDDMRKRFKAWAFSGEYAVDGRVFDIGSTVSTALVEGRGCSGERSNGNGSLMRMVPLAFTDATDDEVRAASAITHAHAVSTESCMRFVRIVRALADGLALQDAVDSAFGHDDEGRRYAREALGRDRDDVPSGGYVLDTFYAALWCANRAECYRDAVMHAVDLGRDTDTTACVAGALAGTMFGYGDIPDEWLEALRGKDIIERCLF